MVEGINSRSRLNVRPGGRKPCPNALTLAGADEEVAVGSDPTKGQVHHRPSVTGAGERSLSHCHSLPVGLEMGHTVRTARRVLTARYLDRS